MQNQSFHITYRFNLMASSQEKTKVIDVVAVIKSVMSGLRCKNALIRTNLDTSDFGCDLSCLRLLFAICLQMNTQQHAVADSKIQLVSLSIRRCLTKMKRQSGKSFRSFSAKIAKIKDLNPCRDHPVVSELLMIRYLPVLFIWEEPTHFPALSF